MLAYVVVTGAMVALTKVGRKERWEALEWLRMGALSTLMGMIIAVQVKFVMLGFAREPVPLIAALTSLTGMACLVGLYVWERWQVQAKLRKLTPLDVPP